MKSEPAEGPFILVADHIGPMHTVESIERTDVGPQVSYLFLASGLAFHNRQSRDLSSVFADHAGNLNRLLAKVRARAVICSTSEEPRADCLEVRVMRAAIEADLPVFLIEDFPGNAVWSEAASCRAVFVESLDSPSATRLKDSECRVLKLGNPRYDRLRHVDREAERVSVRRQFKIGTGDPVLLWAGQPRGRESLETFENVLKAALLFPKSPKILFRAHPRDKSFASGLYRDVLSAHTETVVDATAFGNPIGLCCAADVIVTQFSSMAVEGAHVGTVPVFVLLPGHGKPYMGELKGYDSPIWCRAGGAVQVNAQSELTNALHSALFNLDARRTILSKFADEFISEAAAPRIMREILRLLSDTK